MKQPDTQKLSQLMDGDLQGLDSKESISTLCECPVTQAAWARYHMVRDVLKNESVDTNSDIASRVKSALENEPCLSNVTAIGGASVQHTPVVPHVRAAPKSLAGGLAVAASVAMATVFGLNYLSSQSSDDVQTMAATPSIAIPGQVLPQVELVGNRGTYWLHDDNQRDVSQERRLNVLMSQHIEHAPSSSRQGMLPYSRLVGYDEATEVEVIDGE